MELTLNGTFSLQGERANQVARLEAEMRQLPQRVIPPDQGVHGGIYTRTGLIPAGTTFIGAVHRKDHVNIVCGDVTIATDDGALRLTGYHVLPACAGSKRVAHAHADTMWTTIVRTDLTEFEEIEDESVENSGSLQTRQPKD